MGFHILFVVSALIAVVAGAADAPAKLRFDTTYEVSPDGRGVIKVGNQKYEGVEKVGTVVAHTWDGKPVLVTVLRAVNPTSFARIERREDLPFPVVVGVETEYGRSMLQIVGTTFSLPYQTNSQDILNAQNAIAVVMHGQGKGDVPDHGLGFSTVMGMNTKKPAYLDAQTLSQVLGLSGNKGIRNVINIGCFSSECSQMRGSAFNQELAAELKDKTVYGPPMDGIVYLGSPQGSLMQMKTETLKPGLMSSTQVPTKLQPIAPLSRPPKSTQQESAGGEPFDTATIIITNNASLAQDLASYPYNFAPRVSSPSPACSSAAHQISGK